MAPHRRSSRKVKKQCRIAPRSGSIYLPAPLFGIFVWSRTIAWPLRPLSGCVDGSIPDSLSANRKSVSHRRGVQKNYARTAARNLEVWQKRGRSARACGFLRRVDAFVMPLPITCRTVRRLVRGRFPSGGERPMTFLCWEPRNDLKDYRGSRAFQSELCEG